LLNLTSGGMVRDKNKQDLLRYLRVVQALIRVLQVPFRQPKTSKDVPGFNPQGIDIDTLEAYPVIKSICRLCYEILAEVRWRFSFSLQPEEC